MVWRQILVASFIVSSVFGAGYIGVRPASQEKCQYEDINDAHFSYDGSSCEGPYYWYNIHPCWRTCGSNKRQSPINIDTSTTHFKEEYPLGFENLCSRVNSKIRNNGHSPHFEAEDREIFLYNVPGRNASSKYVFAELHVHLGKEKSKGSEHSIDDTFYPMEVHMVFYDSKYDSAAQAKAQNDSLVVLGVMIEVEGMYSGSNDRGRIDNGGNTQSHTYEEDGDNGNGYTNGNNHHNGYGSNGNGVHNYYNNGNDYNHNRNDYYNNGYDSNGYNHNGHDSNGYNNNARDTNGYNSNGHDTNGYNNNGHGTNGYNNNEQDNNGYNNNGHDTNGYNSNGHDTNGYNNNGHDTNGYNNNGRDINGHSGNGHGTNGYNNNGHDTNGYNNNGRGTNGHDTNDYNNNGRDNNGYNRNGGNGHSNKRNDGNGYKSNGNGDNSYNKIGSGGKGYNSNGNNAYNNDRNGGNRHKNGNGGNGYHNGAIGFKNHHHHIRRKRNAVSDDSCNVRFAGKLSYLMEKYYKKIRPFQQSSHSLTPYQKIRKTILTPSWGHNYTSDSSRSCSKDSAYEGNFVDVSEGITPLDALPYEQTCYSYDGSLTTPPCYETVRWVVFKCPIKVTKKAYKMLALVEDSHREPLKTLGVRRPTQYNNYPPFVTRNFQWGDLVNRVRNNIDACNHHHFQPVYTHYKYI